MTVTRTIAGRDLEFKEPKAAQVTALRLFQQASAKKSKKIQADEKTPAEERLEKIQELYDNFNIKALNFVDSLLVNPDDADFLIDVQIDGTYTVNDLVRIIIHGNDEVVPDDDEDPKPSVAKKAAPNPLKKAAAAKKTANVRRTKK